jgi:hypothetical protein
MAFLEGKRGREMFEEWRSKVLPTFVLGSCFWIPAQAANFRCKQKTSNEPELANVFKI